MKGVKGYRKTCRKHKVKLPDLKQADSFHLQCVEPDNYEFESSDEDEVSYMSWLWNKFSRD